MYMFDFIYLFVDSEMLTSNDPIAEKHVMDEDGSKGEQMTVYYDFILCTKYCVLGCLIYQKWNAPH